MDLKLLAILLLSAACSPSNGKPDPDPETIVQISQEVNGGGCGGGCCGGGCCPQKKSCPFAGVIYPNKALIEYSCLELRCLDGVWNYTGKIDGECGECYVHGDPHVNIFDEPSSTSSAVNAYKTTQTGEFILSQPGFYGANYWVYGNFTECETWTDPESCVKVITYHEPGITVALTLPANEAFCSNPANSPANDPDCDITVEVNGLKVSVGHSVNVYYGTDGALLVFTHPHIHKVDGDKDLYCVAIVGTKGLSVALCQYSISGDSYPQWFHLWALPSLASTPSTLLGLCNNYTGIPNPGPTYMLTERTGAVVLNSPQTVVDDFVVTWVAP